MPDSDNAVDFSCTDGYESSDGKGGAVRGGGS